MIFRFKKPHPDMGLHPNYRTQNLKHTFQNKLVGQLFLSLVEVFIWSCDHVAFPESHSPFCMILLPNSLSPLLSAIITYPIISISRCCASDKFRCRQHSLAMTAFLFCDNLCHRASSFWRSIFKAISHFILSTSMAIITTSLRISI